MKCPWPYPINDVRGLVGAPLARSFDDLRARLSDAGASRDERRRLALTLTDARSAVVGGVDEETVVAAIAGALT